ncbi:hypothetical protein K504DRAFT_508579 [Pleomassaria siparia CBS 279.74]|uniref:Uncharacterized protein n=1 Tax=Pleomassaria siparia CBS 279.74 TaxID=1314801 RepID=A0A6G1JR20_9PLEO|nr:hypothetical protein K504DRAFT_508579 [Pleomassaria siparia CBS 279.74]
MQFFSIITVVAALGLTSASALPQTGSVATGACGIDTYLNQYYCIIRGVSYGCATGTCEGRSGPDFPCSGGDGVYECPK